MSLPNDMTLKMATELRSRLAGNELPPAFAKLYSQYTKLNARQPGLSRWQATEATSRFNDAMRILEASTIERESGSENWRDGIRRTAELFEWLSSPELRPDRISTHLFSAALYQIAGFPARAFGILNTLPIDDIQADSEIVSLLLKADFKNLLGVLARNWNRPASSNGTLLWKSEDGLSDGISELVIKETVSALGILCASMRWGNDARLQLALQKFSAITNVLLHGEDTFSWLLAKLSQEATQIYTESTLRQHLASIIQSVDANGKIAIERYIRQSYISNRSLAWPSQVRGIERLSTNQSFALCTPTGSGKTTVAEIAILQSLFLINDNVIDNGGKAPLVIYLVPSKALASEVEAKLARVLRNLERQPVIIVTGLYGGTDWGPTDAWLTSNDRTILICTYEKAEALLRFLGPLFVNRIKLVIMDEAHSVQFEGKRSELQSGDNRSLRLEALGMRLLSYIDQTQGRAVALSAVSSGGEQALAGWITGNSNASPEQTYYRSTRQLIGRLECKPNRHFEIRYDLLDGSSLSFAESGEADTPYILDPFPPYPSVTEVKTGVETRLRPYLFWAAMNLAAADVDGHRHPVLISLTQGIGNYAEDFLNLLDADWIDAQLPDFFEEPKDSIKAKVWQDCLKSCKDYFSEDSFEYQLLSKGIAVHHGKMPGLMGRLLVQVVREQIVHLVLATSTLTEGVNLPFEIILVPTLRRSGGTLDAREFGNLIGRAGRPGVGTEGKSLVLLASEPLPSDKTKERISLQNTRLKYFSLIEQLTNSGKSPNQRKRPLSPIAELIKHLEESWEALPGTKSQLEFWDWIEKASPVEFSDDLLADPKQRSVIETLDALDGLLLSAIVEMEQLANQELETDALENKLKEIWRRSFAYFASQEEKRLGEIFVRRGQSLKAIYPDPSHRRRLYCTSLQPRPGSAMLLRVSLIREHLSTGAMYALWQSPDRFEYIKKTVELIAGLPKFNLGNTGKENLTWIDILLWWLDPKHTLQIPERKQVTKWYDYVAKNFSYKFNWGLGSVVALIVDEAHGGQLKETQLDEWPQTHLPWIVLWIKELIIWGTVEPVAAYLLSQGMEITREDAEKAAAIYYSEQSELTDDPNSLLDPREIRKWASQSLKAKKPIIAQAPPSGITVELHRNFDKSQIFQWRVLPVEEDNRVLHWFDPAGFLLATSKIPDIWSTGFFTDYDFILDVSRRIVTSTPYL